MCPCHLQRVVTRLVSERTRASLPLHGVWPDSIHRLETLLVELRLVRHILYGKR